MKTGDDAHPFACIGCGYDVRTLALDGACPECGLPIRDTVHAAGALSRRQFVVLGTRLLAIFVLVQGIGVATQLAYLVVNLVTQRWSGVSPWYVLPTAGSLVLYVLVAALLWFGAGVIARLAIPADGAMRLAGRADAGVLASVLFSTLGLYFTAVGALQLLATLASTLAGGALFDGGQFSDTVWGLCAFLLGLALLARPQSFVLVWQFLRTAGTTRPE